MKVNYFIVLLICCLGASITTQYFMLQRFKHSNEDIHTSIDSIKTDLKNISVPEKPYDLNVQYRSLPGYEVIASNDSITVKKDGMLVSLILFSKKTQ